jgi:hypothetical protein
MLHEPLTETEYLVCITHSGSVWYLVACCLLYSLMAHYGYCLTGLRRPVVWYVVTSILVECVAFIFKVEDGGSRCLRNVGANVCNNRSHSAVGRRCRTVSSYV